jgi:hypothetical protein
MPHGRVIVIFHGSNIELAHFRNGELEGNSLLINYAGKFRERLHENGKFESSKELKF